MEKEINEEVLTTETETKAVKTEKTKAEKSKTGDKKESQKTEKSKSSTDKPKKVGDEGQQLVAEYNLESLIEAMLFVSGVPVEIAFLTERFASTEKKVLTALENLKKKYSGDCGIHLLIFKKKAQFASNASLAEPLAEALEQVKEKALSRATLETMAIVAYKQPCTRLDIEDIRGVDSSYAIDLLEKNNLIEVVGRKEAMGKPLLFGTTETFLKRFGLDSLENLPSYEELMSKLAIISNKPQPTEDSLFNFEIGKQILANNTNANADNNDVVNEIASTKEIAASLEINNNADVVNTSQIENKDNSNLIEKLNKEVINKGKTTSTNSLTSVLDEVAASKVEKSQSNNNKNTDDIFANEEIPDFLKGEKLVKISGEKK
jgi:segregation and condensation protein B